MSSGGDLSSHPTMSTEKEVVSDYKDAHVLGPDDGSINKGSLAGDKIEEVAPVTAEGVPTSHR